MPAIRMRVHQSFEAVVPDAAPFWVVPPGRRPRTDPSARANWTIPVCRLAKRNTVLDAFGSFDRPHTVGMAVTVYHCHWYRPSPVATPSPNMRVLLVPSVIPWRVVLDRFPKMPAYCRRLA